MLPPRDSPVVAVDTYCADEYVSRRTVSRRTVLVVASVLSVTIATTAGGGAKTNASTFVWAGMMVPVPSVIKDANHPKIGFNILSCV